MVAVPPLPVVVEPLPDALGRPLRDLRLSVTDACNFRCPYCMPEDAAATPKAGRLGTSDTVRLVRAFARLGVRKLRITGGEPLLRRDLPALIAELREIPGIEDLALTTNGSLLARQAGALRAAGLSRLTVSLDTLDPQRFARLSGGRGKLRDVLEGIEAADRAGFARIKVNCVVQRGVNEDDAPALVAHFRGSGHVVRFIEYMDVGTCNGWRREQVVPAAELRRRIAARWPLRPLPPDCRGEVAGRWALQDGSAEIGFIASVTAPFCGDCTRARLSARGELFTCLFAARGHDLRPLLAGDDALLERAIAALWRARDDRYSQRRAALAGGGDRHVEMFRIGG